MHTVVDILYFVYPGLPLRRNRDLRSVEKIVPSHPHLRRGAFFVFGPECLEEFSSVISVLERVENKVTSLGKLRNVCRFDKYVSDFFVSVLHPVDIFLLEVVTNRSDVEVVDIDQRVSAAFFRPLRTELQLPFLFFSQFINILVSKYIQPSLSTREARHSNMR